MDSNSPAASRFLLRPAKTSLKKSEQNGSSSTENGNSSNPFALTNNPFLKCDKDEPETTESNSNSKDPAAVKDDLFKPAKPSNLFTNATTLAQNSNFVFGQNLHERVVIDKVNTPTPDGEKKESENTPPAATSNDGLLFSSALGSTTNSTDAENDQEATTQLASKVSTVDSNESDKVTPSSSNNSNSQLSLVEAARKYEEMKGAQKRKYEEVEIITGEEDEENVVEMNCKLYTFENMNWEERGRGTLRLNDKKKSSRLVFRASGSHRVLLNTKVWRDQQCEKPSAKSLRLTAFNSEGQLKIYVVQGRAEDIENLFHELQSRIEREQRQTPEKEESSSPPSQNDLTEEVTAEPAVKKLAAVDE